MGFVGLINTAIRDACGTRSLSSWSCFPTKPSGTVPANPVYIATRMRQALDQTDCDRIGHTDEDERNRRRIGVDRDRVWRIHGDDDRWTKRHQLSHERGDPLGPSLRITILDLEVPAHDIPALA